MHPFVQSFADELVKLGAAKTVLTPQSSNVKGWSYDPRRQELTVTFRSGGTYRYSEVPQSVARAMRRNKSAGKTIHKWVKAPGFAYEKVSASKCRFCDQQATKGVVWADGRGIVHCCDRHEGKAKGSVSDVVAVRDLTKQASVAPLVIGALLGGGLGSAAGASLGGGRSLYTMAKRVKSPKKALSLLQWLMQTKAPSEKEIIQELVRSTKKGALIGGGAGLVGGTALGGQIAKAQRSGEEKRASVNIVEGMAQKRRQIAKLAGAAKKQVTFDGVTFKLEYLPGDVRSGVSRQGVKWERKMHDSYGYLPGTYGQGADGEAIDVYLASEPVAGARVYKVAQQKKGGGFDEDKYMVGYESAEAAKKAYLRHMPEWAFGSMTGMSMEAFRSMAQRKAA